MAEGHRRHQGAETEPGRLHRECGERRPRLQGIALGAGTDAEQVIAAEEAVEPGGFGGTRHAQ